MLAKEQVLKILGPQSISDSRILEDFVVFMTTNQPEDHSGSCDFQDDPSGFVLFAWRAFKAGWEDGIDHYTTLNMR